MSIKIRRLWKLGGFLIHLIYKCLPSFPSRHVAVYFSVEMSVCVWRQVYVCVEVGVCASQFMHSWLSFMMNKINKT